MNIQTISIDLSSYGNLYASPSVYSTLPVKSLDLAIFRLDSEASKPNTLKSLEAKRKLSEARGYAAGASILANNNPKFINPESD